MFPESLTHHIQDSSSLALMFPEGKNQADETYTFNHLGYSAFFHRFGQTIICVMSNQEENDYHVYSNKPLNMTTDGIHVTL